MTVSSAVDMVVLEVYASLLQRAGHKFIIQICDGLAMKVLRTKSANHIFMQMQ